MNKLKELKNAELTAEQFHELGIFLNQHKGQIPPHIAEKMRDSILFTIEAPAFHEANFAIFATEMQMTNEFLFISP